MACCAPLRDSGTLMIRRGACVAPIADRADALSVGARVGEYELVALLGAGGMADVWLARRCSAYGFARLVALKTVRAEYARDPGFRAAFRDEARLLSAIHHANVASVLDLGEDGDTLYQVLSLVDGESLATILDRRPAGLPVPIALSIARDLARGLEATHSACDADGRPLRIVHRDVSPHNVLVGVDGLARIADFGVALPFGAIDGALVVGRPSYHAPEQRALRTVDARTDVYAAGVVLWEALGGLGGRNRARLRAVAPEAVIAIVDRALQAEPARRYESAAVLADALDEAARLCGPMASPAEVGAVVASPLALRTRFRKQGHARG